MSEFKIFHGNRATREVSTWPEAPPWRRFSGKGTVRKKPLLPAAEARTFISNPRLVECVNAAIHLRRPLLVTGKPGSGKTSLAEAIAYELQLGRLLVWPINSRSVLNDGLYRYDAIGRVHETTIARQKGGKRPPSIGQFIRLGPLGTALLPSERPRVLLIDEIDKSDVDLPNDLLHVFEKGAFEIPELSRSQEKNHHVRPDQDDGDEDIHLGNSRIECNQFPIVVLTSNGEREFPDAFKRRCIRVEMPEIDRVQELAEIVEVHLAEQLKATPLAQAEIERLIQLFLERKKQGNMATDQLLNAIRLRMSNAELQEGSFLLEAVFRPLS